ncbi:MAG: hypothetical protein U5J96_07425 [Ignavibacteriaceae bacterium]|nr:hypothetical protein [Ignavibacteriaceae bacterium]
MNNTVVETYSYPAIQIVAHDPIPVTINWNMIGGYETSPTIVALKAANPQITGSVFGYNGIQYVAADNLVPGYGYWANVTNTNPIVIPDALSKGSEESSGDVQGRPACRQGRLGQDSDNGFKRNKYDTVCSKRRSKSG